jgi:hypothetical protein
VNGGTVSTSFGYGTDLMAGSLPPPLLTGSGHIGS